MSKADKVISDLYTKIMEQGVKRDSTRMFWKDGTPAYYYSVFGGELVFEPSDGLPLLTKKFVPIKSLTQEIMWIWQKMSNEVSVASEMGTKVWNDWALEDGTIGKAYGYQLRNNYYSVPFFSISDKAWKILDFDKVMLRHTQMFGDVSYNDRKDLKVSLNQVEYVIQQLIDNPFNRQIITTLWKISDLDEMSLQPCVYETHWIEVDGKIDLIVRTRSSDSFLGLPYNIAQYSILHRLISSLVGKPFGTIRFQLGDVHLYDRHFEKAEEFIGNKEYSAPKLVIEQENVHKFEDYNYGDNFYVENYSKNIGNSGTILSEVCLHAQALEAYRKQ